MHAQSDNSCCCCSSTGSSSCSSSSGVTSSDYGTYNCVASNSLGAAQRAMLLYGPMHFSVFITSVLTGQNAVKVEES